MSASLNPATALPLPSRQHIGWLSPVYQEVLLLASQARHMGSCSQMWMQLALAANRVVDRYNNLVLDYFDAYDVWFEDGIEHIWHPDCAQKGAKLLGSVVEKFPLGYLTQLEFELRQVRRYMRDLEEQKHLSADALKRFHIYCAMLKQFLAIEADTVPSLLMSDVALAYKYLASRAALSGLDVERMLRSDSLDSSSEGDVERLGVSVNALIIESPRSMASSLEGDDDYEFVVLDEQ